MLTAVIISPDRSVDSGIHRLALASGQVTVYKALDGYPNPFDLVRLLNTCEPDLLFLDLLDWEKARPIAMEMRGRFPTAAILGIGGAWVKFKEQEYCDCGITALLVTPLELCDFEESILRALRQTRAGVYDNLIAFLPAKAGDGASMTAFNVAGRLANDLKQKVLLIDGDQHSGVLSTRAGFTASRTLQDVLADSGALSHSEWLRYVVKTHGLEILAAGSARVCDPPQWSDYYQLLQFTCTEYDTVIIDLPEVVGDVTSEVVVHAAKVCLVCTTDMPSIELARRGIRELTELGVDRDRQAMVINRWRETDLPPGMFQEVLDRPVAQALPLDFETARRATDENALIDRDTGLGAAFLTLTHRIAGLPQASSLDAIPWAKPKFRLAALLGR